jgi:hypothetical protein
MARKRKRWTAEETQRFKDLALLINDVSQPIEARTRADRELKRWIDGMLERRLEDVVEGLAGLAMDGKNNSVTIVAEASAALLRLTREPYPDYVCTVLRGSCDDTAVCAKCGTRVSDAGHFPGGFPGVYCASCCPACSLIPKEHLREVPVTAELAELLAEHGHGDTKPVAREVIRIVRDDHWNISSRAN